MREFPSFDLASGEDLDRLSAQVGIVRKQGTPVVYAQGDYSGQTSRTRDETDEELRARMDSLMSVPPGWLREAQALYGAKQNVQNIPKENNVKVWKIRQKSSGLFWNDVRWAALEGNFSELAVQDLDDDREMVNLLATAPKFAPTLPVVVDTNNTFKVGERVKLGEGVSTAFAGLRGAVVEVSGIQVGLQLDGGQSQNPRNGGGSPWFVHHSNVERLAAPVRVKVPGVFEVGDKVQYKQSGASSRSFWGLTGVIVGVATGSIGRSYKVTLDPGQLQGGHGLSSTGAELVHYTEPAPAIASSVRSIEGHFGPTSPVGNRPEDHPYWPRGTHPNTGETYIKGRIDRKQQIQVQGMTIAGVNLFEGRFECQSGASSEGTYTGGPGSTWTFHNHTVVNMPHSRRAGSGY